MAEKASQTPGAGQAEVLDDAAAGAAQGNVSAGAETAADSPPEDLESLKAALAAAQQEAAAAKDARLRAQAEVENIRRRASRDVQNAHKFALERFAADLLPVLDGLEKSAESAVAQDSKAIADGVALLLKLFLDTLGRHQIEQVDPLGAPFDPAQSEAMAMVEHPHAEPNSVVEVMQKGYLLNGRLVRAAKVIVAKAPAAAGD